MGQTSPVFCPGLDLLFKLIELMEEWWNNFYTRQYKVMGGFKLFYNVIIEPKSLQRKYIVINYKSHQK